jgi:hypothetical protein
MEVRIPGRYCKYRVSRVGLKVSVESRTALSVSPPDRSGRTLAAVILSWEYLIWEDGNRGICD